MNEKSYFHNDSSQKCPAKINNLNTSKLSTAASFLISWQVNHRFLWKDTQKMNTACLFCFPHTQDATKQCTAGPGVYFEQLALRWFAFPFSLQDSLFSNVSNWNNSKTSPSPMKSTGNSLLEPNQKIRKRRKNTGMSAMFWRRGVLRVRSFFH